MKNIEKTAKRNKSTYLHAYDHVITGYEICLIFYLLGSWWTELYQNYHMKITQFENHTIWKLDNLTITQLDNFTIWILHKIILGGKCIKKFNLS